MSWLARSLANSLIAADDQAPGDRDDEGGGSGSRSDEAVELGSGSDPNQGVKDDLSELTQTLTRQFWGVASFLAPPSTISSDLDRRLDPPAASGSFREEVVDVSESAGIGGIRSDIAEIGGRFRSGISRLSNRASFNRIASSLIPLGAEEDEEEYEDEEEEETAVGVTEEVMVFARNIAMHPETWLDFPLFNEFEDTNGLFSCSRSIYFRYSLNLLVRVN